MKMTLILRKICLDKRRFLKNIRQFSSQFRLEEEFYDEGDRPHTPVMVEEVVKNLNLKKGNLFLDMTFGAGGHTEALLSRIPKLQVFALDRDPTALDHAEKLKEKYPGQIKTLEGKFSDLPSLLNENCVDPNSFDGVLIDSGCSSMQLENGERGFSIFRDGPLDMRMDGGKNTTLSAADLVAHASADDLFKILKVYGGEKSAFKIAQAIVQARIKFRPLKTTKELAELIETVCGNEERTDKLNRKVSVATKTFQALRIFVNNELNELHYGLVVAHRWLKPGGRAAVLTFHSGEDTIVKRMFRNQLIDNRIQPLPLVYFNSAYSFSEMEMNEFNEKMWEPVNKKVIVPTKEEIEINPRSRSAKLRVAVKL